MEHSFSHGISGRGANSNKVVRVRVGCARGRVGDRAPVMRNKGGEMSLGIRQQSCAITKSRC